MQADYIVISDSGWRFTLLKEGRKINEPYHISVLYRLINEPYHISVLYRLAFMCHYCRGGRLVHMWCDRVGRGDSKEA